MFEMAKLMVKPHVDKVKEGLTKFKNHEAGLGEAIGIVQALVAIVVIGAIGIYVADQTLTTAGTPSNTTLLQMQGKLLTAGSTGSGFITILVIAFIGGIAMAYMFGMFGRAKRR